MPHQCVTCGEVFSNDSDAILEGCTECKGKLFFYIKKGKVDKAKEKQKELTEEDKEQIEKDLDELIEDRDTEKTVVLDIETINILGPGQYEIDIIKLFEKQPLVYKVKQGKYVIDVKSRLNDN